MHEFSQAILESLKPRENYENDYLRMAYEKIWREQYQHHKDNACWWKEQFLLTSDEIVQYFQQENKTTDLFESTNEIKETHVEICNDDKIYKFNAAQQPVVFVGRSSGCDIQIKSEYVSRLAAIIYLLPNLNLVLIVDVGSFCGFKTLDQGVEIKRSKRYHRQVLSAKWQESCAIELALGHNFTITPISCLICYERPRSIRFHPCSHFVTCSTCSKQCQRCPTCKSGIQYKENRVAGIHSFLPKKSLFDDISQSMENSVLF